MSEKWVKKWLEKRLKNDRKNWWNLVEKVTEEIGEKMVERNDEKIRKMGVKWFKKKKKSERIGEKVIELIECMLPPILLLASSLLKFDLGSCEIICNSSKLVQDSLELSINQSLFKKYAPIRFMREWVRIKSIKNNNNINN